MEEDNISCAWDSRFGEKYSSFTTGNRDQVVENDDFYLYPPPGNPLGWRSAINVHNSGNYPSELDYRYDRRLAELAGWWCGAEAFRRLRVYDTIAVANVFSRKIFILEWANHCRDLQVELKIHETNTPWAKNVSECLKHNVHNVPPDRLQKFHDEWEQITQEEINTIIHS